MSAQIRWLRANRLIVPSAVIVIIASCGGGPQTTESPGATVTAPPAVTPTSTVTPSPTPAASAKVNPSPTPERPVAGRIAVVSTIEGRIDERLANNEDEIRERQTVRTNEKGSLTFNLVDTIDHCDMYEDSTVAIKPSAKVALDFEAGEFFCETQPGASAENFSVGDDVDVETSDALFIVSVGDQDSTVRVLRGVVTVRNLDSSATLGAWQLTDTTPGTGLLADPRTWEPVEIENSRLRTVIEDLDLRPDLSMPDQGGSVALDRMDESDSIRVGWPEGLAADPATLDFVAGFLAEQSTNWGLSEGTTNEIVQDDSAAAALQAGTIDVFISPVQIPGLDPIPLFEDPQGQQYWLYYDPADPAFGEAQREYVRTVVGDEAFRDLYTEELHAEPTYEGFSELFGLEQP